MRDAQERLEIESIVLRICWMLVFAFAWQLASVVLAVVVIVQLCCRLLQGRPNGELMQAGDSLTFEGDIPHGPEQLVQVPIRLLSIMNYGNDKE